MKKQTIIFIYLFSFTIGVYSQEIMSVNSKIYGKTFEFNVSLPKNYTKENQKYAILYNPHPLTHNYLSGLSSWLSHNGNKPWIEIIVITPKKHTTELNATFALRKGEETTRKLLKFYEKELLKKVEKQYRINGFKIYSGFSGSGTFGIYTLLNKPKMFNAYIISSPTLGNNNESIVSLAKEKLKNLEKMHRFLFISNGNNKFSIKHQKGFENLMSLLNQQAPETLDWHYREFNHLHYMSQPVVTDTEALEVLFKPITKALPADHEISQKGYKAIIAHYQKLSEDVFGFDVSSTESLDNLGEYYLKKEPIKALEIFTLNIRLHPKIHWLYHSQARSYLALNQIERAIAAEGIALGLTEHPYFKNLYKKNLNEFRNKLKH